MGFLKRLSFFVSARRRRGLKHFVEAVNTKVSICAPKLGDKTSLNDVILRSSAGLGRTRDSGDTARPQRFEGVLDTMAFCFPKNSAG